jgi:hypothetical protein
MERENTTAPHASKLVVKVAAVAIMVVAAAAIYVLVSLALHPSAPSAPLPPINTAQTSFSSDDLYNKFFSSNRTQYLGHLVYVSGNIQFYSQGGTSGVCVGFTPGIEPQPVTACFDGNSSNGIGLGAQGVKLECVITSVEMLPYTLAGYGDSILDLDNCNVV